MELIDSHGCKKGIPLRTGGGVDFLERGTDRGVQGRVLNGSRGPQVLDFTDCQMGRHTVHQRERPHSARHLRAELRSRLELEDDRNAKLGIPAADAQRQLIMQDPGQPCGGGFGPAAGSEQLGTDEQEAGESKEDAVLHWRLLPLERDFQTPLQRSAGPLFLT